MIAAATTLVDWTLDARERTLAALAGLDESQQLGPCLAIVNPPLWELGHVAWFNERWAWRELHGLPPLRADGDALYDSARVAHDTRWHLPLPSWAATEEYARTILERLVDSLAGHELDEDARYFHRLAIFHEDMHCEAFLYTRQTLAYAPPAIAPAPPPAVESRAEGDAAVPGGDFLLGAAPGTDFVFDNEKWAHPVRLAPFHIARTPVTNAQFAAFVADGGYRKSELWSADGWRWRQQSRAEHPAYWRSMATPQWELRVYDEWLPLPLDHPVIHVNWYEAEAYCRWAKRRLPTEAEWEAAAAGERSPEGTGLAPRKRPYPWGDEAPRPTRANLDARHRGTVSVHAYAAGDSAWGCRQMWGNVWEWTSTAFHPYPGFAIDPYQEYSAPWFATHHVLRGGCWATRARLLRNTWRNFYTPERRDVFAGFRTCAIER